MALVRFQTCVIAVTSFLTLRNFQGQVAFVRWFCVRPCPTAPFVSRALPLWHNNRSQSCHASHADGQRRDCGPGLGRGGEGAGRSEGRDSARASHRHGAAAAQPAVPAPDSASGLCLLAWLAVQWNGLYAIATFTTCKGHIPGQFSSFLEEELTLTSLVWVGITVLCKRGCA